MNKRTIFLTILTLCFGMILNGQMSSRNRRQFRNNMVPNQIPFQGRLTDDAGNPIDAITNITFALYDVETNGTSLWSETQTVNVENGLFSVQLGSLTTIDPADFDGTNRWIGISVDTDSEMTPRTKIASVPYAFTDDDWTKNGSDLYFNDGNVGIGTDTPDTDLTVYSDEDQQGLTLQVTDNTFSQGLRFRNSGGAYTWNIFRKDAGSNSADLVFANGTESDITNLTDHVTFQNGGNVGIGTTTPDEKLSVIGKMRASNDIEETEYVEITHGGGNGILNWDGDGDLQFRYQNSTLATLKQAGDFDIPSTQGFQIGGDTVLHKNGPYGIFVGKYSGQNITSGAGNTFLGQNSGRNNTEGDQNVFLGYSSGRDNTTGTANTYISAFAGTQANGNNNTVLGYSAGYSTKGTNNVFVGYYAAENDSLGNRNTFLGSYSGRNCNGDRNVFLGYASGANETDSDKLYIANTNTTSPLIWGDFANERLVINGNETHNSSNRTFYVNGQSGGNTVWYNDSDERLKKNITTISNPLEKIKKLRGVNFEWKDLKNHIEGTQMGFIAQEAEKVIPEVVQETNNNYSMSYSPITALLVEGMKEQQKLIEELKKQNKELLERIEKLETKK